MSMLGEHRGALGRNLEQVFGQGTATALPEGQLLRRFVAERDESAFAALISRHGPMVLGVCRRVLGARPDAEDAFQATFLVLLRRANALQDADSLGPWLYGVAWRVASRARAGNARRRVEEENAAATRPEQTESDCPAARRELHAIIDEEINRLPEKYRRPLVLCYLEGLTREAAAQQLRWKAGVLRGRLDRARLRLRGRLTRRGLAPAATLAIADWLGSSAQVAVAQALVDAAVQTACRDLTAGKVSGTLAVTAAATPACDVLRKQLLGRAVLIAAVLASGTLALATLGTPGEVHDPKSSAQAPASTAPSRLGGVSPAGRTIELRVVDRSRGKPLPGVRLTVVVGTVPTVERTSDDNGVITFDYPSLGPNRVHVDARKEGYLPMRVGVSHPGEEEEFPSSFTLKMIPAARIGGLVKDEEGRPVFGAKVWLGISGPWDKPQNRAGIHLENALTDALGRWNCPSIPPGYHEAQLRVIRIRHPDFQTCEVHNDELTDAIGPNGTVVLRRGIVVTGRVVDREGHPVRGARVGTGSDWFGSDPPIVETDGDGRFRLGHLRPGETVITVQAKGHGPERIELDLRKALSPVELKLATPRTIQGSVVDRDGRPLRGISVTVAYWRRLHTLDWNAETGTDGRFRWENAPREEVWLNAFGNGFIGVQNHVVPAMATETVIKLASTLLVSGTVIDYRTRKPIESFLVTPGTESEDGSHTYWDKSRSKRQAAGRYEFRFREPAGNGHLLRIEAEGYTLGISRRIADSEGEASIDFELVPAAQSRR
jgi:RNA polymerase sigma factor (sigma-70 family)